jgi:hypothetical protein
LSSITIPTSVTYIGGFAFSTTSVSSTAIPSSVKSYASYFGCPTSTTVTVDSSYTSISDSAFESCTSIQSIIIPTSVISIGIFITEKDIY